MSSGWIVEPLRVEGQEMSLVWYITKVISYFLVSLTLTLWETHRPNVQRALFWIRSKPELFPGFSWGVFLRKTLSSHHAPLQSGVRMGSDEQSGQLGRCDATSIPSNRNNTTPSHWVPQKLTAFSTERFNQCSFAFYLFEIFCLQVHLGSSTLPWRLIDLLSKRQPLSIAFLRSYLTPPWQYWLMTAHGTIRSKDGRWSQDKEPFGVFIKMNVCISGEKN